VIFDYGNVLSQAQPETAVQDMAGILALSDEQFKRVYWQFRIDYDAAVLDPAEYWSAVARAASRTITPQQIDSLTRIDSRGWSHAAPITPQWARDLRAAGLRTALLSNMPFPVRDHVLGLEWLPPFDLRVFSCDLRRTKPDPEIYEYCLRELGVAASNAVFLDDRPANISAAEALGMPAVLFQDPTQAFAEIARRFELPVPAAL
jgi:putative hydrolase of the HAD superfamily